MGELRSFFCGLWKVFGLWHVSDVATKLKQFHVVKQRFFLAVCSSRDLNALALGFGLSSKAECECLQTKDVSQLQETVFF